MSLFILLPPSEGKRMDGGDGSFRSLHPEMLPGTESVLRHAKRLRVAERAKFYSAKDPAKAKAIHALNQDALDAPCLPAIERYTGVVYQYIDFPSLGKKDAAKKRIHIVSGLFGLIAAGTRIPAYKLPINPWLLRHWRGINAERLQATAAGHSILSLLPQSYAKAIQIEDALHVDFRVQGGSAAAGHFGKAIKGKFVRFLIENAINDAKDFGSFQEDGYQFNGQDFIQS